MEERTAVEWLKCGLSSRRHEKYGWLIDSLRSIGKIGGGVEEMWERVLHDDKEQLAYIERMRACCEAMNVPFEDPRS